MTAPSHERGGQELATSTLAEIYAQQGLLERALAIYERIVERSPDDPVIAERMASLSRAIRERNGPADRAAAAPAGDPGPSDRGPEPTGRSGGGSDRDEEFDAWLASR